ncbi:conserved glutamic acid-rich protein [Diplocarpon rosae]|nr:conserved glutamic acid-rich protein [Diplocarpon rosae]
MEISSEHGHNMDQEDIDIDLDLTAGSVDEDYILEDAASQIDFGNESHPQPSPIVNDESMLDDDNESYQMEDVDLLNEGEGHTMDRESNIFTTLDEEPPSLGTNDLETVQYTSEDAGPGARTCGDDALATKHEKPELNLEYEDSDILEHDDAQYLDQAHCHNHETLARALSVQESQTSTPSRHSSIPTAPAEARSPLTPVPETRLVSPNIAPEHTEANFDSESPHVEVGCADIAQINNKLSNFPDVRVVYRNIEYDLFSSSELDDPDSFFLSDVSMAEKPLDEFFRAMREVINGDLADEDELWILVESLGLEAGEKSSFLREVSLKEILNLHAELLHNDGIEPSSEMFCVQLKTRIDFSRRFSNLIAGAAEGKGLAAFGSWNEQSPFLDDTDNADGTYEDESNVESRNFDEIAEVDESGQEPETAESKFFGSGSHATSEDHEQFRTQDSQTNAQQFQEIDAPNINRSTAHSFATTVGATTSQSLKEKVVLPSDVDEDGDLIGYSDGEDDSASQKSPAPNTSDTRTPVNGTFADFIDPCLSPEFCFCPKCADLIILADEEVDQDYRRRSLSRVATEDNLSRISSDQFLLVNITGQEHQKGNEYEQPTGKGDQRESPEVTEPGHNNSIQIDPGETSENREYSEENGYKHTHGEVYEHSDENPEQTGLTAVHGTAYDREGLQENEFVSESVGGNRESGLDNLGQYYTTEQGANDGSALANSDTVELEFEEGETGFEDTKFEHLGANVVDDYQERLNANSMAAVETTESSVTMSADADEIQYEDEPLEEVINKQDTSKEAASPKEGLATEVAVEYTDEIGYDDDEEDAKIVPHLAAHDDSQSEVKAFANANGKRSIADVESTDSQTLQTKDVKRTRS